MKVAMIPARAGSKRIPKKNIKNFRGKPIIAWSINAAIESKCFDEVLVSTDSKEIASIAKDYGAKVPFLRPKNLSDDFTTTLEVVMHCLSWLESKNLKAEQFCCLYATAPFVKSEDFKNAFKLLNKKKGDKFIYSATNFPSPIQRAIKIDDNGISSMFFPEFFKYRSQDLENSYHDTGQFYLASPKIWKTKKNHFEGGLPIVIPNWRVQDIDTNEDWVKAELLHQIVEKIVD